MKEIEIKNNEYCGSYPTKIVINHNLRPREYPICIDEENMIFENDINSGKNSLKITLEIDDQGYSKKDILNKINLTFEQLKEYYC